MIWVIEPHSDDAFISLGGHIERWIQQGESVTVVTIYGVEAKRAAEAREYCAAVGAESAVLSYHQGEQCTVWDAIFGLSHRPWSAADSVYYPLGIQHPDHQRVAATAIYPECKFYLEIPYYTKQMNQLEVARKTAGMTVESIFTPSKRKWRHRDIYKSQSKFFYFNSDIHFPEIILCK